MFRILFLLFACACAQTYTVLPGEDIPQICRTSADCNGYNCTHPDTPVFGLFNISICDCAGEAASWMCAQPSTNGCCYKLLSTATLRNYALAVPVPFFGGPEFYLGNIVEGSLHVAYTLVGALVSIIVYIVMYQKQLMNVAKDVTKKIRVRTCKCDRTFMPFWIVLAIYLFGEVLWMSINAARFYGAFGEVHDAYGLRLIP